MTTSTVELATSTLETACGGSSAEMRGMFMGHSQNDWTLPEFFTTDSCGTTFASSSSYVAWIYTQATTSTIVSSTAVSYADSFDTPVDENAPQIDHTPVHTAKAETDAVINSFIFDDQTTVAQFANTGDAGDEYFKLYYGADVSSASSSVDAVLVNGDLFQFTVPSGDVPADGGSFEYFLVANDASDNVRYICNNYNADSVADCESDPFVVNTASLSSTITISGTITSNFDGNPLAGVKVFASGFAGVAVTTNGSGVYTLTGIPQNSGFDITAGKESYCDMMRYETTGTANLTGVNMNLNYGTCGFFGDGEGSPFVIFSGPPDGDNYFPVTEKIRVGFNQGMNAMTINDGNAADAGSNVYLTTNNGTTKIAGSVLYCADTNQTGCSNAPSGDTDFLFFNPSSNLATSTFYTLVVTEEVQSNSGQSLQGNRAGGGHKISFTTGGGQSSEDITANFGTAGGFMPPFVRSMVPSGMGTAASPNTNIFLEFSEAMNSETINTTNINLFNMGSGNQVSLTSVTLDSNKKRSAKIVPASSLATGNYEVRVKGTVSNSTGVTMGSSANAGEYVFYQMFEISGSADTTGPTIYPLLSNDSTGVSVGQVFEFGFNEMLDYTTINNTNITMYRGSNSVSISVEYDPGRNSVFVIPQNALAPSTKYTINITTGIEDVAGNAIASNQTYNYTTGGGDTTAPSALEARCDDYMCYLRFSEAMNNDKQVDTNWANSVLNGANYIILDGQNPPASQSLDTAIITYDSVDYSVEIKGLQMGGSIGQEFTLTASTTIKDKSGNALTAGDLKGLIENNTQTFGMFGDMGMFGPPVGNMVEGGMGGVFKPEGFGSFTGEQFMFGQADMAFPFNSTASQDVNVFQVGFTPGVVLADDDIVELTFPNGTNVASVAQDSFSPFQSDFNQSGSGSITFGNTDIVDSIDFNSEGIAVSGQKVYIKLAVTGTLDGDDPVTIDLRNITNPAVPKGPETGGYTLGIKVKRSGSYTVNKTSMPYFINTGGTNSIKIAVYAASTSSPDNVSGNVFVFGGGPSGPMDAQFTLSAGVASTTHTNLNDGCYFFGTDPFVTLGSSDYFGQMNQEPVCVSSGQDLTKNFILTSAAGGNAVTTTVKFVDGNGDPFDFGGKDIDIFAGGPGQFMVKTLSNVGVSAANGYPLRLRANGHWFIGMGPSMPKSASGGKPASLGVTPPPPMDVVVSGLGSTPAVSAGGNTPPSVSFNDITDTITFTFATADKTITGTVTDGTNSLANVEVFIHSQGFGAPVFTETANNGTFSLSVSSYGSYEIGAFKQGLPSTMKQIEVKVDGSDVGTDPDIYFGGTKVDSVTLKLKKPSYYISGKILDSNGNGIGYAPVFASDANGNFIGGGTDSGGKYTLYVDNGTWTVGSQLPPEKSDTCGTFSKTVIVSGANKTSQNISPSAGTCYTLSGTVTVDGSALQNVPLFVDEWDSDNDRPVAGGFMRGTSADSNGEYSVKLGNGTYRIGTWHPDYGEIGVTVTVSGANKTQNISATAAQVTFSFTGGSSDMEALVELKHDDFTTNKKRIGKKVTNLSANHVLNVESGQTYKYFVDVFGVGKFNGTVVAGETATVDLGITSNDFITVTGTIKDASDNTLAGALVTFADTTNNVVKTAVADNSGNYSVQIKAGTYNVGASLGNYVPGEAAAEVTFTVSTTGHSFASGEEHAALEAADKTIEGIINDSTGSPMDTGYVWAENNTTGVVIKAPVDADDGSYSLPVIDGEWTVKAAGPSHAETEYSVAVDTSATSQTGKNFNLTADATREPASASSIVSCSTGGSMDDSNNSGIKLTAGAGVLQTGSGNVTLSMEKTFIAPDSENFEPLSNATFGITATGNSTIKNLNGNVEVQFDYTDLVADLPEGVDESDLQLMYYSPERGDYIPVEGGATVDTVNNTVTGFTNHFTDFVLAYVPLASSLDTPAPTPSPGGSIITGSNPPSIPETAEATEQKTVSEIEFAIGEAVEVTVGASTHTVTVLSTTANEATITIESDPVTVILTKDEAQNVDTNADEVNDLQVTYLGLTNGQPKFEFVNLTDATELTNSFTINYGAYETYSRTVMLKFNATGAKWMAIANDSEFTDVAYEDYSDIKTWELTAGNGTKYVYARFRSEAGGVTSVVDTIELTDQVVDQECGLTPELPYKHAGHPGVYYITDTCTKRPFKRSDVFFTYFDSWNDVEVISKSKLDVIEDDTLGFMPWGPKYDPKYGALVKIVTDPKVYLLLGTERYWITSETVFTALKYSWNWIEDIAQSLLAKYTAGSEITDTDHHPNYSLIKYPDSPKVYRLEPDPADEAKQVKRWIPNEAVFNQLKYRWDRIVETEVEEIYEEGEEIKVE